MTLNKYIQQEVKRQSKSKTALLKELSQKTGVSLLTLQRAERGELLKLYPKAKLISDATGGAVKPSELLG